jgi:hypothetical protein
VATGECRGSAECDDRNACTTETCVNGSCSYVGCPVGQNCCGDKGCAVCCDDPQCSDGIDCTTDTCQGSYCAHTPNDTYCINSGLGSYCIPEQGGCVQCKSNADCGGVVAAAIPPPGDYCGVYECVYGICQYAGSSCPSGYQCCLNGCVSMYELCTG